MSTQNKTRTAAPTTTLTTKNKVGLALAAVLGLNSSLVSPFALAGADDVPSQSGPLTPVLIVGALLGVLTLIMVVYTWRTASRTGARVTVGIRIIGALLSPPTLFVSRVAPTSVTMATGLVVVTIATAVLILSRRKTGN